MHTFHDNGLPRLAWIAEIDKATLEITAYHGRDVELDKNFMVEGVWNGKFSHGEFHSSEHFFGSGLRVDDNSVWLVPSTALVDRIWLCDSHVKHFASNSLVCLLAYLGATPDPKNNYKDQSDAILKGVESYNPTFPICHDQISALTQLFYFPVRITKEGIQKTARNSEKEFSEFHSYILSIKKDLSKIFENSLSSDRKNPMLNYSTISRGYDSTAVTALTREFNLQECFTSKRSSSGLPSWLSNQAAIDDGTDIATKFGLNAYYLDFVKDEIEEDEILFICASPAEPEIVFYKAHKKLKRNKKPALLFTGYHGDKVWEKSLELKYLDSTIVRGDTSGVNLSEARLKSGFINVAVPFMYASHSANINRISNSEEMHSWSIGGDYDRPIPRRIVEELGVSRADFGTRKKAVISFYNEPINRSLRNEFRSYLKASGVSRTQVTISSTLDRVKYYTKKINSVVFKIMNLNSHPVSTSSSLDLPYKMYFWALNRQVKAQRDLLENKLTTKPE